MFGRQKFSRSCVAKGGSIWDMMQAGISCWRDLEIRSEDRLQKFGGEI